MISWLFCFIWRKFHVRRFDKRIPGKSDRPTKPPDKTERTVNRSKQPGGKHDQKTHTDFNLGRRGPYRADRGNGKKSKGEYPILDMRKRRTDRTYTKA